MFIHDNLINECTERFIKDSNDCVIIEHILYTKSGKELIISRILYLQEDLESDRATIQNEFNYWDSIDNEEISNQKALVQSKLDRLQTIEDVMNSVTNESSEEENETIVNS